MTTNFSKAHIAYLFPRGINFCVYPHVHTSNCPSSLAECKDGQCSFHKYH